MPVFDKLGRYLGTPVNMHATDQLVDGPFNFERVAEFDGISQYVDFGDVCDESSNELFSVSFWVKTTQNIGWGANSIIGKGAGPGSYPGWSIDLFNGRPWIYFWGENYSCAVDGVNDGNWHHVVVVHNGLSAPPTFYIDGTQRASNPSWGGLSAVSNSGPLYVGRHPFYNGRFEGKLGDVSKWPIALSDSEVTELYRGGMEMDLSKHSRWSALKDSPRGLWVTWEDPDRLGASGKVYSRHATGVNQWQGTPVNMLNSSRVAETPSVVPAFTTAKSMQFNQTNYVDMGNVCDEAGLLDFTLAFWMKSSTQSSSIAIGKAGARGYSIQLNRNNGSAPGSGDDIGMYIDAGDYYPLLINTPKYTDDKWHLWVIGYRAGVEIAFWLDGVYVGNVPTGMTYDIANTHGFWIGAYGNGGYTYLGLLGDCYKLPFVPTNAEVTELFNLGLESDLTKHSRWNDIQTNSRSMWVTWETDTEETVYDLTLNRFTGTLVNSPLPVDDSPPSFTRIQSMQFDGVNDYVDFGNICNHDIADSFSISFWVKTSSSWSGVLGKTQDDGGWTGFRIDMGGGVPRLLWHRSNGYLWGQGSSICDGNWHHVVFVWGTYHLYIDGIERTTLLSGGSDDHSNAGSLTIGKANGWGLLNGELGDISLWDFPLSSGEALELFNLGIEGNLINHSQWNNFKSNAKSLWVSWEKDSSFIVHDFTNNRYTGIPTNGPVLVSDTP